MNALERLQALLRHERPDRLPCAVAFYDTDWGSHPGRPRREDFETDLRFVSIREPDEQRSFLKYLSSLPPDVYVGAEPILRTYHDWGYHPEIPPDARLGDARTVAEIAAAPLPDFMAKVRPERLAAEVAAHHRAGYPVIAAPPHLGGELFETCYRLRGFQQFLIDLIRSPELVDYLLEQLTAMHLAVSVALARAGIDVLALDDDVGEPTRMILSPDMWRRFFKPRFRTIIEACRRVNPGLAICWHSDGFIEPIIPDLIEIGVNILNPVQPDVMDPARLKQRYGEQLVFFGTVGTPQLWAWGRPADIRAEVRRRVETVGYDGGLILSPAYDLEPAEGIPWANVRAFFEAVEEYGRF
jgi:uroporphyrinogen decarboxylase